MKVLSWNNQAVGDYDLFIILNGNEVSLLQKQFEGQDVISIHTDEIDEYYYFVNSSKKRITPMPMLSLAFGGQYNGYPPYSDDAGVETIDFEGYQLEYSKWHDYLLERRKRG